MRDGKQLNVSVSAETKARLVADADARGESLNDRAVAILAARFGVSFTGTGRRSPGARTSEGPLPLWVPLPLYRKIHTAAIGESKTALVERVFRQHYELADLAAA